MNKHKVMNDTVKHALVIGLKVFKKLLPLSWSYSSLNCVTVIYCMTELFCKQ